MTGRLVRGLTALTLAVALGAGSGAAAVALLHDHREQELAAVEEEVSNPGDRVRNAVAGLADDGVYVAPDARDMLSEKGERTLVEAVAASTTPVQVVVWSVTHEAGGSPGDLHNQLQAVLEESGTPSVLFVWQGPEDGWVDIVAGRGFLPIQTYEEFAGDPAVTLPRLVSEVDERIEWYGDVESSDYWGGLGGGIAAGLLIGSGVLLGILCLYGVIVLVAGRRLPGGWRW